MTTAKRCVTIKGVKEGLIFLLDDACSYAELVKELSFKLEKTHQKILTGPTVHVQIKTGNREMTEEQKEEILQLFQKHDNLLVQSVTSERKEAEPSKGGLKTMTGIIRSGQSVHYDGDLFFLGDVHPGGVITAVGDIYIMGSLKGVAHAGIDGNSNSIIAASHLKPTQLRIADVISRPPDEWGIEEVFMEFAYLNGDSMEIDKIVNLHRRRPAKEE